LTGALSSVHVIGFTLVTGGALVANLNLLGVLFPGRPPIEVTRPASRGIAAGLAISALTGLLLFYGASYLTHPSRPLRSLYNIATRRYESRLEMSFGNLVRRVSSARAQVEAA